MPKMQRPLIHTHESDAQGGRISHSAGLSDVNANSHHFPFPQRPGQGGTAAWVVPGWHVAEITLRTVSLGDLYFSPIFVPEQTTFDRIAVGVNAGGGGGSKVRLGIYNWSDGAPAALVLDAGTVNVVGTGDKEIVIAQQLDRGYYFLAAVSNAAPQLFAPGGGSGLVTPVQALDTGVSGDLDHVVLFTSGRSGDVDGGLPAPAPAISGRADQTFANVRLREQ